MPRTLIDLFASSPRNDAALLPVAARLFFGAPLASRRIFPSCTRRA